MLLCIVATHFLTIYIDYFFLKFTRGIWKVMHIHPYNFTQCSEKKDECISVNVRIKGFMGYHVLMFAFMR